jgi:hypothetical protein
MLAQTSQTCGGRSVGIFRLLTQAKELSFACLEDVVFTVNTISLLFSFAFLGLPKYLSTKIMQALLVSVHASNRPSSQ